MDSNQFMCEVIGYIKSEYSDFKTCQRIVSEIFDIFNEICKKNEIKYFYAYGSLLGEIRDGGPIPWDADVDVCIPIEETERLTDVLKKTLPDEYFVTSNYLDSDFPFFQMRIGKKGYSVEFIHLDIFYLLGLPNGADSKQYRKRVVNLFNVRYEHSFAVRKYSGENGQSKIMYYIYKLKHRVKSRFLSVKAMDRKFEKLRGECNYDNASVVCAVDNVGESYKKSDLEPIVYRELNGRNIAVPNNIVNVFNKNYRDYTEYLPISNRFDEFYSFIRNYKKASGKTSNANYMAEN